MPFGKGASRRVLSWLCRTGWDVHVSLHRTLLVHTSGSPGAIEDDKQPCTHPPTPNINQHNNHHTPNGTAGYDEYWVSLYVKTHLNPTTPPTQKNTTHTTTKHQQIYRHNERPNTRNPAGYDEYWVLEVHYNNPEEKAGLHDATGMEVRHT